MKKLIATLVMGLMVLSILPFGLAAYGSDAAPTGGGAMKAVKAEAVKFEKRFAGDEVRRHFNEAVRPHEVRDLRDELKEKFRGEHVGKLKDLMKKFREDRDHFNYDEYKAVIKDYFEALNHILDYLQKLNPEERGVDMMKQKIDHAMDKLESLPPEPSKDQIREVHRALKDVKNLIQEIKAALRDADYETKEAGRERVMEKIKLFADKLKQRGMPEDRINECWSKIEEAIANAKSSETRPEAGEGEGRVRVMLKEGISCFRNLAGNEERPSEEA